MFVLWLEAFNTFFSDLIKKYFSLIIISYSFVMIFPTFLLSSLNHSSLFNFFLSLFLSSIAIRHIAAFFLLNFIPCFLFCILNYKFYLSKETCRFFCGVNFDALSLRSERLEFNFIFFSLFSRVLFRVLHKIGARFPLRYSLYQIKWYTQLVILTFLFSFNSSTV